MSFASTTITVSGTPTVFLPLATAWPSTVGCTSNIYLHTPTANPHTFIAWDPLYGAAMDANRQSCLPPQVTAWWQQTSASPYTYTALGPEFQCPEAYSAVQTVIVASSLRQTLCCPSQYTMLVPQPMRAGVFPSQCVSTVTSGQTFTHITSQGLADAAVVVEVMKTSALVFAIPVNGFSIATGGVSTPAAAVTTTASASTPTSTSTPAAPTSATTPPGVYAGIAVGVIAGLALLGLAAWLCFRRRRAQQQQQRHGLTGREKKLSTVQIPHELHGSQVSGLGIDTEVYKHGPQSVEVYELPDRYSRGG